MERKNGIHINSIDRINMWRPSERLTGWKRGSLNDRFIDYDDDGAHKSDRLVLILRINRQGAKTRWGRW